MIGEEIEHRAQHPRIAQAAAQLVGRQPGQVKQAFRPARILQRPAERAERQRGGPVVWRGRAVVGRAISKNCQPPAKSLGRAANKEHAPWQSG